MKSILFGFFLLTSAAAFSANELLFIDPQNIHGPSEICVQQPATVYTNLGITDIDLDMLSIMNIQSSNMSVIDPSNNYFVYSNTTPDGVNYFSLTVYALSAGTTTLTIQVTDGIDTVLLTLPPITAIDLVEPQFTTSLIELCTNQGLVDLTAYLPNEGGTFYSNSLEVYFEDGLFDTDNSPLPPGSTTDLSYESNGACYFTISTDITINGSPTVNITQTATTCGQSTGTATALVSNGTTPYAFSQWSSGQQNTNSVSGLAAGEYAFTIIDAAGCQVNEYFNINPAGVSATGTVQNVLCHGNATGGITVVPAGMTAPISALWSSGHSTISISGLSAGNYTVQLSDAAGCTLTKSYTVTEPALITSDAYTSLEPTCGNSDGELQADNTFGGTGTYSYAWSNGDLGPVASTAIDWGIYSLTITDDNGCMIVKTLYVSESGAAQISGTVTGANCGTAEASIDVTSYPVTGEFVSAVSWSNGAVTEDIFDVLPALYICTLETTNNCIAVKGWNIPVVAPLQNPICVVSVDDTTTTNLVVWERTQPVGIAYYNIYRETSVQGNFALIDTVHAENLSIFNDVVASPLARSWRYKISAVNACNVEGPLSLPHQTIHLDVLDASSNSVTVNWNAYEGAAFSSYTLSRYTDANGWEIVASLPPSVLSYTDPTPFATPGLDYMVEMELDETCTAVIYRSQDFNSSRSNKDKGQFLAGNGTGDSNNGIDEAYLSTISIYPNPATDMITIEQSASEQLTIEIRSVDGQLINGFTTSQLSENVTISGLANGIYFVTARMNHSNKTTRIIKQ